MVNTHMNISIENLSVMYMLVLCNPVWMNTLNWKIFATNNIRVFREYSCTRSKVSLVLRPLSLPPFFLAKMAAAEVGWDEATSMYRTGRKPIIASAVRLW